MEIQETTKLVLLSFAIVLLIAIGVIVERHRRTVGFLGLMGILFGGFSQLLILTGSNLMWLTIAIDALIALRFLSFMSERFSKPK